MPARQLCSRLHNEINDQFSVVTRQMLTSSWKQVSVSSSGVRKDDEKTSVNSCVAKPDQTYTHQWTA